MGPKFGKIGNKNNMRESKMSEEYMTYLEDKGRKILGL